MILQNIVGAPSAGANNALLNGRAGQLGDAIVSELHGRYYETNYRDSMFFGGHGGLTALVSANATVTSLGAAAQPVLGIYNPSNSGKNAIVAQAALSFTINTVTTPVGPGAWVWAISVGNAAVSTGLTPYSAKTLAQSGSSMRYFVGATALTGLTNNLTIVAGANLPTASGLTYGTVANTSLFQGYVGREDFDGSLIIPPGGVLALMNTVSTTTFSVAGRLTWEEVVV